MFVLRYMRVCVRVRMCVYSYVHLYECIMNTQGNFEMTSLEQSGASIHAKACVYIYIYIYIYIHICIYMLYIIYILWSFNGIFGGLTRVG